MADFDSTVQSYLVEHHWQKLVCAICGRVFYSKSSLQTCKSYLCSGQFSFLQGPRPKRYLFASELCRQSAQFFLSRGFTQGRLNDIVNRVGDTLFIVAGIQYFDAVVHQGHTAIPGGHYVAQPSIRLKFLDRVKKEEGISSSFVNVCTEQLKVEFPDYFRHLETWLDYFSAMGIYAGHLTLIVDPALWSKSLFRGRRVIVNYGGVELGDGIFIFDIWGRRNESLTMIDFGFGFERILWALNRTSSYYSNIGPLIEIARNNHVIVDIMRTMVLMASSGVRASNRGHGYQLKKLAKRLLSQKNNTANLPALIEHSYNYWKMFIDPPMSLEQCRDIIQEALHSSTNMEIAKRLGVRPLRDELKADPEVFYQRLVQRGIPIESLAKLNEHKN